MIVTVKGDALSTPTWGAKKPVYIDSQSHEPCVLADYLKLYLSLPSKDLRLQKLNELGM